MHKLSRDIRFSVNPFLDETPGQGNSYCSKPSGEGLAVYLGLWVELEGDVEPDTGFVVNLTDIDRSVREQAVPIFDNAIRKSYRAGKHINFCEVCELLEQASGRLKGKFGESKISSISLNLNPNRVIKLISENKDVVYYSEKFEFAAMHKLWNDKFSDNKNFEVFGKCANPAGHGHNYVVEVTISIEKGEDFSYGSFARIVDDLFISLVDHRNLNADVDHFKTCNATLENITRFGWDNLTGKFENATLDCVKVWENDRAFCSYYG